MAATAETDETQQTTPGPIRRRGDKLPPMTRSAANQPTAPRVGGCLRNEILLPIAVGSAVLVASVGIIAAGAEKLGLPIIPVAAAGGLMLTVALMVYVSWIVDGAASRPLSRVRTALQEMEEGNYDARLLPDGAAELCELAEGFNRMATIVGHQRERLKIAAATDSLTGLANHRHFQERLRADILDSRETGAPMAVATLDIDGFKKLNDEHGHARGDEALRLAGEAIERAVRSDDLVARLGGDDFVMILRGADAGYAREVTERARDAMARSLPEELGLTVSGGFVCFPDSACEDGSNLSELSNAALD